LLAAESIGGSDSDEPLHLRRAMFAGLLAAQIDYRTWFSRSSATQREFSIMEDRKKKKPGSHTELFSQDHPGSPGALQRGCTCPAAENNFGRGRSKGGVIEANFATDPECPIHGIDVLIKMLDEHEGNSH
jgi:hypothetical protein